MQYRDDNKSGNKLSALGLGCMRFPLDKKETAFDYVQKRGRF
jgi:predicted aldo/keto reductase-like oxidoreductase